MRATAGPQPRLQFETQNGDHKVLGALEKIIVLEHSAVFGVVTGTLTVIAMGAKGLHPLVTVPTPIVPGLGKHLFHLKNAREVYQR